MVKVQKYSKEKKKRDTENARAEVKKQKYSLMQNLTFAMREIWRADKKLVVSCFGFAAAMFVIRLTDVYFQKYVVELAVKGFERKLLFMCLGVFLLRELCNHITTITERYRDFIGGSKAINHFSLMLFKKCITTDYENMERCKNNNSLNKATEGARVAGFNTPINLRGSVRHILEFFTYSAILSMLSLWLVPIVAIPALLYFFIERHQMIWIWNMTDNWQRYDRQHSYIKNTGCDL